MSSGHLGSELGLRELKRFDASKVAARNSLEGNALKCAKYFFGAKIFSVSRYLLRLSRPRALPRVQRVCPSWRGTRARSCGTPLHAPEIGLLLSRLLQAVRPQLRPILQGRIQSDMQNTCSKPHSHCLAPFSSVLVSPLMPSSTLYSLHFHELYTPNAKYIHTSHIQTNT